ncbi:isocitrate lyase/PEP mutase family protein [Teichococcus vastitatis]|uniref:Isocitrate lyase/PEP mutase family protein n=1 Tax=Teichococcus vastitatis TaxID=2307076 RepID=A0ABS9VZ86_9PROT|nr:isocitrate lyase/PEP mutase family protein [Pseudoroseomonas vastitatis]MCI0752222.1 isocitrate lyase/PEP mutase family protein [Pseudoroseomonas vastitatis]
MPASLSARRARFRAVLQGPDCRHPASVFDPLSARIAEDLGFELGMVAGSTASLAVLGAPDLVVLTLSELAEQVRRMARASALPLLVDADHGYGNALSVMRTVQELEGAGAAGLTIEDTALPAPFGGQGGAALLPLEEGLGKLRAAMAARQDPSLVIAARTGAFALEPEAAALARVRAYSEAGADAVFLTGITRLEPLRAVRDATALPVLGFFGALDAAALGALGVRVALQGHQPMLAAIGAVRDTLAALRAGTPPPR